MSKQSKNLWKSIKAFKSVDSSEQEHLEQQIFQKGQARDLPERR